MWGHVPVSEYGLTGQLCGESSFLPLGVELKVARLAITNTLTAEAPQVHGPGGLVQYQLRELR